MRIIYCDSVIDHKVIEPDYAGEQTSALKAGFSTSLISFEALVAGDITTALRQIKAPKSLELALYRGWMLRPDVYDRLYEGLLMKNIQLFNTLREYKHCHYLPESYSKIEAFTPKSHWTINLEKDSILALAGQFGNSPIIVKDFVKSEKHHWKEACYIPDASDADQVMAVVNQFLKLRGDALNEGLVFRQFEALEYLTDHSKSGMPLTKEFRLFFAHKRLVQLFNYWDEGEYGTTKPELDTFTALAATIGSSLFTMDIAQKQNGDWIVMELGDGQVAGLPDNADVDEFYHSLQRIFMG